MGTFLVKLALWLLFIEAILALSDRPRKEVGETMVYIPEFGQVEPSLNLPLPWTGPRIYLTLLPGTNLYQHERWNGWHKLAWCRYFYCDDMTRALSKARRMSP